MHARIVEVGAILCSDAERSPDGFAAFLRGDLVNARRVADLAGLKPS